MRYEFWDSSALGRGVSRGDWTPIEIFSSGVPEIPLELAQFMTALG